MTIGFVIILFAIGLFFGLIAILGTGFQTIAEERARAEPEPDPDGFFADDPPTVEHPSREQVASEVQASLSRDLHQSALLADDPERLYTEQVSH